jgi:uncharacterized protein
MNNRIIEKVKEFYKKAFEGTSPRRKSYFGEHIEVVVKYSKELARERGADEEICEISAWLHDIATLKDMYEEHHIEGVKIAEKFLRGLGYPEKKIEQVKHCILNHRGSKKGNPQTKEAQVIIDADAMSHFDYLDSLKAYYKSDEELLGKLERTYAKMSSEAKENIKHRFDKLKKELKKQSRGEKHG